MKRWVCGLLAALALVLLATAAASAHSDLWATGKLPDEAKYKYPTAAHFEWLRWDVCQRGTDKQFSDCLVKVNLLEKAWTLFIDAAIEAPAGAPRMLFADTLDRLYEETARMDALFRRGSLAQ